MLNIIGINTIGALSESPGRFDSCSMRDLMPLKIVILLQTVFWSIDMNTSRGAKIVSDLQQIFLFWQLQRNSKSRSCLFLCLNLFG